MRGYFGEILVGAKLFWIYKNGDDDWRALRFCGVDEGCMASVQRAHRGDEAENAVRLALRHGRFVSSRRRCERFPFVSGLAAGEVAVAQHHSGFASSGAVSTGN